MLNAFLLYLISNTSFFSPRWSLILLIYHLSDDLFEWMWQKSAPHSYMTFYWNGNVIMNALSFPIVYVAFEFKCEI